jgi:hypothetical protein
MDQLDNKSFPEVGSNEYNLQKVFTSLLFDILNLPSFETPEELGKAIQGNNIKIAYNPGNSEFAIGVDGDEFEPMLIVNTNFILQLMKKNHPLRPVAEQFEGREYGSVITLDEAIELNRNGRVVIAPNSDDLIRVYGIGSLADHLDSQTIEFDAGFSSDKETVLYYVPSHQDKFITVNDFEKMISVLGNLQGGSIEAYPVIAYEDSNQGFVVEVKGMDTYSFTIYEDGDIYGSGLVMEI